MTPGKLSVKQKRNHRHREQTDGCKEEEVKGGMDWEVGVSRYKLLHTERISNKNLHYSTENNIQYLRIKQQKRMFRKRMYMWMCVHVLSHFSSIWLFVTPWTVACQAPLSRHGILQARILEWVAVLFFRGTSWPRDQTQVSCIAGRFFTLWVTREWLRMGDGNVGLDAVACVCVCVCVCARARAHVWSVVSDSLWPRGL